jgi:hypothetical protein
MYGGVTDRVFVHELLVGRADPVSFSGDTASFVGSPDKDALGMFTPHTETQRFQE